MPGVFQEQVEAQEVVVDEVSEVWTAYSVGPAWWAILRTSIVTLSEMWTHWRVLSRRLRSFDFHFNRITGCVEVEKWSRVVQGGSRDTAVVVMQLRDAHSCGRGGEN